MAHDLEIKNGTGLMVSGEKITPWHGLGIVRDGLLTAHDIASDVPEFASPVKRVPLIGCDDLGDDGYNYLGVDSHVGIVRTLDSKLLSVMSADYKPLQNTELLTFGQDVIEESGAVWTTAGLLRDGRVAWAQLKLPNDINVGGSDAEKLYSYLLLANSFDGSVAIRAKLVRMRVVCRNTFDWAMGEGGASYVIRHVGDMGGRLAQARELLNITFKADDAFAREAEAMMKSTVTRSDVDEFTSALFPMPEAPDDTADLTAEMRQAIADRRDAADRNRTGLVKLLETEPDLADIRHTRWGVFQGTVEFAQRTQSPGRSQEQVMLKHVINGSPIVAKARQLLAV